MHFLIVCRRHTVLRSLWSIFKALPTPMPHSKHSNLYTKKLCPLTTWSVLASEHARTVSVMKHSSILHTFQKKQRFGLSSVFSRFTMRHWRGLIADMTVPMSKRQYSKQNRMDSRFAVI